MLRSKKNRNYYIISALLVVLLILGSVVYLFLINESRGFKSDTESINNSQNVPSVLQNSALKADYSKASVDLVKILSGGPGKDGIPAITDPKFVALSDSKVSDDTEVIYAEHGGEEKLYPLNILVWHEIVNDIVGGKPLAVTFCPLCGSAIVFEREVDGDTLEFGVSGFLYESNLLMYSREDSESLWSQSLGEAVVGQRTGADLEHYPMQLLSFSTAKQRFPDAKIMSTNTGFSRDYTATPYSGYSDTDDTYFPISVDDKRFPAKEVFYIVPLTGSSSIAVRQDKEDGVYTVLDTDITVTFDRGLITANWGTAQLPGYYEMWFSWAVHNQDTGIVFD